AHPRSSPSENSSSIVILYVGNLAILFVLYSFLITNCHSTPTNTIYGKILMFKINIKGVEHQMKSDANELTIKEYEKLSSILNDENTQNIEKYFKAFINLGMDEDILDSLDGFSFLKIIKEFKEIMMPVGDIVKE